MSRFVYAGNTTTDKVNSNFTYKKLHGENSFLHFGEPGGFPRQSWETLNKGDRHTVTYHLLIKCPSATHLTSK